MARCGAHLDHINLFAPEHVRLFQQFIDSEYGRTQYRLHLFSNNSGQWVHTWSGYNPSRRNLIMIYSNSQFDIVPNTAFLTTQISSCEYFCNNCLSTSHGRNRHQCPWTCKHCSRSVFICIPDDRIDPINCEKCGLYFLSISCYYSHSKSKNGRSRCGSVRHCELCDRYYNTLRFRKGEVSHYNFNN